MPDPLSLLGRAIAAVAPHADAAAWAAAVAAPMRSSGIATPRRIGMFLGQVAEETGGFERFEEDFYYTTAERILEVFGPDHFADAGQAGMYIGDPEALANTVYAGRMGNGDAASGDGWRFRGRGLIQLTGRTSYELFGRSFAAARNDPDWLVTKPGAAASACWFWTQPEPRPSLNSLADDWDIPAVTRRVNGGLINLAAREAACAAALAVFGPLRVSPRSEGAGASKLGPTPKPAPILHEPIHAPAETDADRLMAAELAALKAPPAA